MRYEPGFCSNTAMSNCLWPHGLQHTRLPCVHCLPEFAQTLIHWVGDTIQPSHLSVAHFSPCSQSFPASGSFPVSQLFPSGGQSIGASAWASVLAMNIHGWFPLGLTGLIFLLSKGPSRVFCSSTVWKYQFFSAQHSLWFNSHICTWLLEEPYLRLTDFSQQCCLGLPQLSFQGASVFRFHGCSHHMQWFWSPIK